MSTENGGPAFPSDAARYTKGVSKRDYFAAMAMQGICAHHDTWGLLIEDIADRSYEIADAMLKERAK